MLNENEVLDCCPRPSLEQVQTLYSSHHDCESLKRCTHCQVYWFYRFHELVTYETDDQITIWYTRLSDEQAKALLEETAPADRSFLATLPSIMVDERGVHRMAGQPTEPWS